MTPMKRVESSSIPSRLNNKEEPFSERGFVPAGMGRCERKVFRGAGQVFRTFKGAPAYTGKTQEEELRERHFPGGRFQGEEAVTRGLSTGKSRRKAIDCGKTRKRSVLSQYSKGNRHSWGMV